MIGDKITYHPEYKHISDFIVSRFYQQLNKNQRICICVSGESGCGKTSLAFALQQDIEKALGVKGFLFHLDDYYKLPPTDNHNMRLKNISNVGIDEIKIELLDTHLEQFKNGKLLLKPLIDYKSNIILEEELNALSFNFCIVEGTYSSLLKKSDYRIFIEKTYQDTHSFRINRARDILNDFNEQVLEIEHQIIKAHKGLADIIIDKNLKIINPKI